MNSYFLTIYISLKKNFYYDKQKYVESVAEAITYRIITKAYLE